MLLAPFIPLWAMAGLLGLTQLERTRYLLPFAVLWGAAAIALFAYALRQALGARRHQRSGPPST